MLPVVATPFVLREAWSYETESRIRALAFSEDGKLGVVSYCAYILDQSGKLLNKVCGNSDMLDVSYSNGVFGFVNDDGYAYLSHVFKGSRSWKKVYVGYDYSVAITVLPDGFIACWKRCTRFGFNGDRKWDADVGSVVNGPAVHKGHAYMADYDWDKLLIFRLRSGKKINEIKYEEHALDTAACGNYLAVTTWSYLYLYDIGEPANPEELWRVGGFDWARNVAFSPDCRYIAVSDANNRRLKAFSVYGKLMYEKEYSAHVTAVAWWGDRIAVGLYGGFD